MPPSPCWSALSCSRIATWLSAWSAIYDSRPIPSSRQLLIFGGWRRRHAAMRAIPQAKFRTDRIRIELLQVVQRGAVVLSVLADGVDHQAIGGAAKADRIAVDEIGGNVLQEAAPDQVIERFGPLAHTQAVALSCQAGLAASQMSVY